jgi:hypothetical protein
MAPVQQFRIRMIALQCKKLLGRVAQARFMRFPFVSLMIFAVVSALGCAARASECVPAARYVMPDGVNVSPEADEKKGIAPADVPGSRAQFSVPPVIRFNLATNPVGPAYNQSQLDLGQVEVDRKTGETRIDGQAIGGGADPCVTQPAKPDKH